MLSVLRVVGIALGLAVGCVIALIALIVGALAVVVALADEPAGEPRSFFWGNVAPLLTVLLLALVLSLFVWLFARLVLRRRAPVIVVTAATALALFLGLAISVPSAPPDVSLGAATFLKERWGATRYDILLVVDPGDPAGRTAIREARREGRIEAAPGPRWDVRYAITALDPGPRDVGRWSLVQDFTSDRASAASRLATISETYREPAYGGYARLLHDVLPGTPNWGPVTGTYGAIVFFFDSLPTTEELDGAFEREAKRSRARTIESCRRQRPPGLTLKQCVAAFGAAPIAGPTDPLPFLGSWQRLQVHSAASGTHVIVVTTDPRKERQEDWRRKLATMASSRLVTLSGSAAERPLVAAEWAATTRGAAEYQTLAFKYRPYLFFDSNERFGPLDVDRFLAEPIGHRGCPTDGFNGCRGVDSGYTILGEYDHLDLAGGARSGSDLRRDFENTDAHRMYFHAVARRGSGTTTTYRLHLDYWWFFRFNISPVRSSETCLAGVSISDASCFDHEGDWEGMTVTLRIRGDRVHPESVTYATHRELQPRSWESLQRSGSIQNSTHPAVYAAFGSHASYPSRCHGSNAFLGGCNQGEVKLFGVLDIPEGRHNGEKEWPLNDDTACMDANCVVPLPVGPRGAALWNAFDGRWGEKECSLVGRFCVKTEGPLTPSTQARYNDPR